jgi:hypothetical protein
VQTLRNWSPGNNVFENQHHQQAVDGLRELQGEVFALRAQVEAATNRRYEPGRRRLAKIVATGPGEAADYTDSRYWVQFQLVSTTAYQGDPFFEEDTTDAAHRRDTENEAPPSIVTATNLAEWYADTHTLSTDDETYVVLEGYWDCADPDTRASNLHWFFDRAINRAVRVRIASNVTATVGQYNGFILNSDDTDGASCLVTNLDENSTLGATHWLQTNTHAVGILWTALSAEATPRPWVLIPRGVNRVLPTGAMPTLGGAAEGSESASTDTWDRNAITAGTAYGNDPVDLYVTCRVGYWESGGEKLYAFVRKLTIAADGRIATIGAETRVEIDAPVDCP